MSAWFGSRDSDLLRISNLGFHSLSVARPTNEAPAPLDVGACMTHPYRPRVGSHLTRPPFVATTKRWKMATSQGSGVSASAIPADRKPASPKPREAILTHSAGQHKFPPHG